MLENPDNAAPDGVYDESARVRSSPAGARGASVRIARPAMSWFFVAFAFTWLATGMFGSAIVLGVLDRSRSAASQSGVVRAVVVAIIVIASFAMTRRIVRRMFRLHSLRGRWLAVAGLAVLMVLSALMWPRPNVQRLHGRPLTTLSRQ